MKKKNFSQNIKKQFTAPNASAAQELSFKCSQTRRYIIQNNKQQCWKILIKSFHSNGHRLTGTLYSTTNSNTGGIDQKLSFERSQFGVSSRPAHKLGLFQSFRL